MLLEISNVSHLHLVMTLISTVDAVVEQLWRYFAIQINMRSDMKAAETNANRRRLMRFATCDMRRAKSDAKRGSTKKNSYKRCILYAYHIVWYTMPWHAMPYHTIPYYGMESVDSIKSQLRHPSTKRSIFAIWTWLCVYSNAKSSMPQRIIVNWQDVFHNKAVVDHWWWQSDNARWRWWWQKPWYLITPTLR